MRRQKRRQGPNLRRRLTPSAGAPPIEGTFPAVIVSTRATIEVTTSSANDRAVQRDMTLASPQATPSIPSDFLAKRMQRLTAAQCAPDRTTGVRAMCQASVQRRMAAPLPRSLRQVSRPLRITTAPAGGKMSARQVRSRRDAEFRTVIPCSATPVCTAVARCAWRKGIEKICMVTPNDADFVR